MSWITAVLAVAALTVGTYGARAVGILALADRSLPPLMATGLRYVGPAVLSALVVSLVADPEAANNGVSSPEVAGIAVAAGVAWKTRNLVATLAAGMTVFWLMLALV